MGALDFGWLGDGTRVPGHEEENRAPQMSGRRKSALQRGLTARAAAAVRDLAARGKWV